MKQAAPGHSIDISEAAGVRFLHFGSDWVQGAMRIARPWSLELPYTREMMAGLLLRDTARWPRTALLIGLGAGSLAKFLYRNCPACRIDAVEINPQVAWVARHYFRLPQDDVRLRVTIADGADFVLGPGRNFDYVLVDGFDSDGRAGVLDTLPFYSACRARLTDDGLFCANLLGKDTGFAASVERVRVAFAGRVAILPSCESGNTIAFATGGEPVMATVDELRARATDIAKATGLDLRPTIARLQLAHPLPDGTLRI